MFTLHPQDRGRTIEKVDSKIVFDPCCGLKTACDVPSMHCEFCDTHPQQYAATDCLHRVMRADRTGARLCEQDSQLRREPVVSGARIIAHVIGCAGPGDLVRHTASQVMDVTQRSTADMISNVLDRPTTTSRGSVKGGIIQCAQNLRERLRCPVEHVQVGRVQHDGVRHDCKASGPVFSSTTGFPNHVMRRPVCRQGPKRLATQPRSPDAAYRHGRSLMPITVISCRSSPDTQNDALVRAVLRFSGNLVIEGHGTYFVPA